MMLINKYVLVIVLTGTLSISAIAQNDCEDLLYNANKLYSSGKLLETATLLEGCGEESPNNDYLFEVYKLLAIVYHDLNQLDEMYRVIPKLLAIKPDYQKYPNDDPVRFTKALAEFKVAPLWYGGIEVGISSNNVKHIQSYSTITGRQTYQPFGGYQMGITARRSLSNSLSIGGHLLYANTGLEHVISFDEGWQKIYTERIQMTNFSLELNRYFDVYLRPSIGLSAGFGYLTSSNVNLNTLTPAGQILTQNTRNALDDRNRLQPNIGLTVGLQKELERGVLNFKLGYYVYSTNLVNADQRTSDTEFIYATQYINDDVKLGLLTANISYTLPFKYKIYR